MMNIYFKVETTGLDIDGLKDEESVKNGETKYGENPKKLVKDNEVICWSATTFGIYGQSFPYTQYYHPEFKRDWSDVAQYNGITADAVADKPSNRQLRKDLKEYLEREVASIRKQNPNETVDLVMWDAKYNNEMLLKTGFDLSRIDGVKVVNLIEPYSVLEAYRNDTAWKDNPTLVSMQNAFQHYYQPNDAKMKEMKKNPSLYLEVLKDVHTAMDKEIGYPFLVPDGDKTVLFKNSKGKDVMLKTIQEDNRIDIEPTDVDSLYTDKYLKPRTEKNGKYWDRHLEELQYALKEARRRYGERLEKEQEKELVKELPFKVDAVNDYKDGYLVDIHNDSKATTVFVSSNDLESASDILAMPDSSVGLDKANKNGDMLRFGTAILLQDKDVFGEVNNSNALSEAGLCCLDRISADKEAERLLIPVTDLEKTTGKPWKEIKRDLERDIRSEGLKGIIVIMTAEEVCRDFKDKADLVKLDKDVPYIAISGVLRTKYFRNRWEEEKEAEKQVEMTKEDATKRIVLRNANLRGMDMSSMDLSNAVLDGSDLSGTNLSNSNLTGASLIGAKMDKDTVVINTNFENAVIIGMQADGTDFRQSNNLNRTVTTYKSLTAVRTVDMNLEHTR